MENLAIKSINYSEQGIRNFNKIHGIVCNLEKRTMLFDVRNNI